jgi:hypothetical protein
MSKKSPKNPKNIFQNINHISVFRSIFRAAKNSVFSSGFFRAAKKDFFEEIDFGHLSNFKNVHFQKVILSSTKKGGIRLDRLFQNIFMIFCPHNVGILVFCRRTDHRQVRPTRM